MFCRTCESPAAVYNIEKGQPNWSAMEMPHSEGMAYVITVFPVPVKYAWSRWRSQAQAECVQTKYGSLYFLSNIRSFKYTVWTIANYIIAIALCSYSPKAMHIYRLFNSNLKLHNIQIYFVYHKCQTMIVRKHKTLDNCWVNVGLVSMTLAQHWPNIGSTSRACWVNHWHMVVGLIRTSSLSWISPSRSSTIFCWCKLASAWARLFSCVCSTTISCWRWSLSSSTCLFSSSLSLAADSSHVFFCSSSCCFSFCHSCLSLIKCCPASCLTRSTSLSASFSSSWCWCRSWVISCSCFCTTSCCLRWDWLCSSFSVLSSCWCSFSSFSIWRLCSCTSSSRSFSMFSSTDKRTDLKPEARHQSCSTFFTTLKYIFCLWIKMSHICKIGENPNNFHSLEAVDRVTEAQL